LLISNLFYFINRYNHLAIFVLLIKAIAPQVAKFFSYQFKMIYCL